ncbi:hypothetical protein JCM10213_001215 [Rhodosporidiobolus nylandii]
MTSTRSNPRRSGRAVPSAPSEPPAAPSLHQRILFPPSSAAKPPRILHSPAHAALDPLILDLIALCLRAYVTPWYNGGISRDPDKAFLQAVTAVLVHVIQALEVRLSAVDWTTLLVQDLPSVLAQHYQDWDLAGERAGGGTAHNLSQEELFHRLQPHIAISLVSPAELSPSEAERLKPHVSQVYLRTLVDHLLKLLLPPADYRAETERAIVREILTGVVFGTVFNRVAQPWFLHRIIATQLEAREAATKAADKAAAGAGVGESTSPALLDRLLSALAALPSAASAVYSAVSTVFSRATSTSVPSHYASQPPLHTSPISLARAVLPPSTFLAQTLHCLSLPLAFFSSSVDALLVHFVESKLTTANTVKLVLEGAINGMFPNDGWPAPKEEDPDADQQEHLRRRAEEALARALPASLPGILFVDLRSTDSTDPRLSLAQHLLRPLSSHIANVHLFLLIVDLVVGKVFPELLTKAED